MRRLILSSAYFALFALNLSIAGAAEEAPVYVDVRSWAEYQVDGIESDVQIHYTDISSKIGEYVAHKDQPIAVYCAVGGRAEQARQTLISEGYTNVTNLGGINDVKALRGLNE